MTTTPIDIKPNPSCTRLAAKFHHRMMRRTKINKLSNI